MKAYPEENYNYSYEHDVREMVERTGNIRAFYEPKDNTWEVEINYGDCVFKGKISPEGVPTKGEITVGNFSFSFENNHNLINNNFRDTIVALYQDKINEMIQGENGKMNHNNAFPYHTSPLEIIQEQEGESGSEKEEQNIIREEPTQPTKQPQNQSNLNLQHGQNRKFGRSNSR